MKKCFQLFGIGISPHRIFRIMHHFQYSHYTYSSLLFLMCENMLEDVGFRRIMWTLSVLQTMNWAEYCLWSTNWPTYKPWCVQKKNLLQTHRIVNDYMQEKHASSCVYDWANVISKLYDSGRERQVNRSVALLLAANFEPNGIQETLKDVEDVLKNQIKMCASPAQLHLRTHRKGR